MNMRRALVITKKDLKEVRGNGQIIWPLLLVPLIFILVMPTALILSIRFGGANDPDLKQILDRMPESFASQFAGFTTEQILIYYFTVFLFASFFLIIPLMVSSILSANSFAGEKERKTLEGLLYTPISDMELIFGKIMASFIPSLIISWICFIIYSVIVNVLAYPVFHQVFFPTINWWILMVLLVPALSFIAIGIVVLVSAKVRGFQEANSISGAIVIPVILLTVVQAAGLLYLSSSVIFLASLFLIIADVVFLKFLTTIIHRDKFLSSYA